MLFPAADDTCEVENLLNRPIPEKADDAFSASVLFGVLPANVWALLSEYEPGGAAEVEVLAAPEGIPNMLDDQAPNELRRPIAPPVFF